MLLFLKIYRIFFVLIVYASLYIKPSSSRAFFLSLGIFTAALAYDYGSIYVGGLKLDDIYQKVLGLFGFIFNLACIALCALNYLGMVEAAFSNGKFCITSGPILMVQFAFDGYILLVILGIIPILAALEIFNTHERVATGIIVNEHGNPKRSGGATR